MVFLVAAMAIWLLVVSLLVFILSICMLCVCVYFLVQFAAEMSHLMAASIEMAHLVGCTYVNA